MAFLEFHFNAPVGVALQNVVGDSAYLYVDGVALDRHFVIGSCVVSFVGALIDMDIVESIAVTPVHFKIFPKHLLGIRVANMLP